MFKGRPQSLEQLERDGTGEAKEMARPIYQVPHRAMMRPDTDGTLLIYDGSFPDFGLSTVWSLVCVKFALHPHTHPSSN